MRNITLLSIAAFGILSAIRPADAQEAHHPSVSILHQGADGLKADMKILLDLTSPEEQEQRINLEDFIDLGIEGADRSRMIRADILSGLNPVTYVLHIPIEDLDVFRETLDLFGYESRRDPQDRNLYRLDLEDEETGWLRYLDSSDTGILSLTTNQNDSNLLRQIVSRAGDSDILPNGDASDSASALLGSNSLAVRLWNPAVSEDDQEKRRSGLGELRGSAMDAISQRPSESATEFTVRRLALETQLDETERLLAETRDGSVSLALDAEAGQAIGRLSLQAIDNTGLDKGIRAASAGGDRFQNVTAIEGSVLSGRLNHPIDELRQKNGLRLIDAVQADAIARLQESSKLSDDAKTATRTLLSDILELLRQGISTGHINAFIESRSHGNGSFSTVTAISCPNPGSLLESLQLIPRTGSGNEFEENAAAAGDLPLHRLQLGKGFVDFLDSLYGEQRDVYLGLDEELIWIASGPDAVSLVEATRAQVQEATPNPVILSYRIQLLPWVEKADAMASAKPEPTDREERKAWREAIRYRQRALEALQDRDLLSGELRVVDGVMTGETTFDQGLLKLAGKLVAAFTKENLAQ